MARKPSTKNTQIRRSFYANLSFDNIQLDTSVRFRTWKNFLPNYTKFDVECDWNCEKHLIVKFEFVQKKIGLFRKTNLILFQNRYTWHSCCRTFLFSDILPSDTFSETSFPLWMLSQRVCEACGQTIPAVKDIPGPSSRN